MMEQNLAQKERLMAYLDGEMNGEERLQFEKTLLSDSELQRELAQFQRLKSLVQKVRIPQPKPELWDEYARRPGEKGFRFLGWALLLAGLVVVFGFIGYQLWSDSGIPWILKGGITLILAGAGLLLCGVIHRRCRESKTDRYKEILR